jgi:hypothetical protein
VVEGPFARRKFWQTFTVAGGKLDEKGQSRGWNIAKSAFRAMIDSALGLNPKDESAAAKQKRVIQGLKQLDGIAFAARIMIDGLEPQYRTPTSSPTSCCRANRSTWRSCAASHSAGSVNANRARRREPRHRFPRLGGANPARRADIRPVGRAIGAAARQARRPGLAQHLTAEHAVRRLGAGGASPPDDP